MSSLGSFLDPLSDKILMTTMYLTLTYVEIIPAALTALVVSRDLLLIYAGLYVRYMSVIPPVRILFCLVLTIFTISTYLFIIYKFQTFLVYVEEVF